MSSDPLKQVTREPYSYAGDNPLNVGDATGLFSLGEIPVIGGGLEKVATRFVGFWDGFTRPVFGGTAALRSDLGWNGGLNQCSAEYQLANQIGGYTLDAEAVTAALYAAWPYLVGPILASLGEEGAAAEAGDLLSILAKSIPDAELWKVMSAVANGAGVGSLAYLGARVLRGLFGESKCGCS